MSLIGNNIVHKKGKVNELPHFTGEKKRISTLKASDRSKEKDNDEFTKPP